MGVKGLWNLLATTGKLIDIQALQGQRLAIDVSIWVIRLVYGHMNRGRGEMKNIHLIGIFQKVLQMLMLRIQPVFVFDGQPPELKRQTIMLRNQMREKRRFNLQKMAQRYIVKRLDYHIKNQIDINEVLSSNVIPDIKMERETKKDPFGNLVHTKVEDQELKELQLLDQSEIDQFQLIIEEHQKEILESEFFELVKLCPQALEQIGFNDIDFFESSNIEKAQYIRILQNKIEQRKVQELMNITDMEEFSKQQAKSYVSYLNSKNQVAKKKHENFQDIKQKQEEIILKKHGLEQINEESEQQDIIVGNISSENQKFLIIQEKQISEQQAFYRQISSRGRKTNQVERNQNIREKLEKIINNQYADVLNQKYRKYDSQEENSENQEEKKRKEEIQKSEQKAVKNIFSLDDLFEQSDDDYEKSLSQKGDNEIYSQNSHKSQEKMMNEKQIQYQIVPIPQSSSNKQQDHDYNIDYQGKDELQQIQDDDSSSSSHSVNLILDREKINKLFESSQEEEMVFKNQSENIQDKIDIEPKENKIEEVNETREPNQSLSIPNSSLINFPEENRLYFSEQQPSSMAIRQVLSQTRNLELFEEEQIDQIANFLILSSQKDDKSNKKYGENQIKFEDQEEEGDMEIDMLEKKEIRIKRELVEEEQKQQREQDDIDEIMNMLNQMEEDEEKLDEKGMKQLEEQFYKYKNLLELESESMQNQFNQVKQLLVMFGIPWVEATGEAEAQCAFLQKNGLVDGIITDDSDVFLFGGKRIYRNVFNNANKVEFYDADQIPKTLGLNNQQQILLSLFLGSDYTLGIRGVGIVNAMEIVEVFDNQDALVRFRNWAKKADILLDDTESHYQEVPYQEQVYQEKHKNYQKSWELPPLFPDQRVITAYKSPYVDESLEQFTWGQPNFQLIKEFCFQVFGWPQISIDNIIDPLIQKVNDKSNQSQITDFFQTGEKFAFIGSQRLGDTVKNLHNQEQNQIQQNLITGSEHIEEIVNNRSSQKQNQKLSDLIEIIEQNQEKTEEFLNLETFEFSQNKQKTTKILKKQNQN